MSKKPTKFSDSEKLNIATSAALGGEEAIKSLAAEHNVTEDEIREWVREMKAGNVNDDDEVTLDVSEDFAKSVEYGATFDILNYNRLTFWSLFGSVVIVLFIVAIMFMHEYTRTSSIQDRSEQSIYYDIEQLNRTDRLKLDSFGVVDPDEGIYRIPIDSAITIMATD
jgi:predicted transcriptional regulator